MPAQFTVTWRVHVFHFFHLLHFLHVVPTVDPFFYRIAYRQHDSLQCNAFTARTRLMPFTLVECKTYKQTHTTTTTYLQIRFIQTTHCMRMGGLGIACVARIVHTILFVFIFCSMGLYVRQIGRVCLLFSFCFVVYAIAFVWLNRTRYLYVKCVVVCVRTPSFEYHRTAFANTVKSTSEIDARIETNKPCIVLTKSANTVRIADSLPRSILNQLILLHRSNPTAWARVTQSSTHPHTYNRCAYIQSQAETDTERNCEQKNFYFVRLRLFCCVHGCWHTQRNWQTVPSIHT